MISSIILLLLASGLPYYLLLEKSKAFNSRTIFLISATLLLFAVIASNYLPNEHPVSLVIISYISALYTIYKAIKTTNFYKLGYYLIFINAPFFMLFEGQGALYSTSMLVSLLGLYLIARFYEKNYGSANYLPVRGITLATPYIGTYITIYLITIALYPPFPNALLFLSYIFKSEPNILWYMVVLTLFFANFLLAMKVMEKALFGRANANIHYVDFDIKEKMMHSSVLILLLILSIYGLKETLL